MPAPALTPTTLFQLPVIQASNALANLDPQHITAETQRARLATQVLLQPDVVDRYEQVHSRDLTMQPLTNVADEVFGPDALKKRRWLAPFAFATASVVGARYALPFVENQLRSWIGLAETVPMADQTALLYALGLAIGGTAVAGGISSLVPVQKPITVRWPYATPWRRTVDYFKVALINGPVVGVQQLTQIHFPQAKLANKFFSNTLNFSFNFGLFGAFMSLTAPAGREPNWDDIVTSFGNGAILAFGQVFCANHITEKMVGNPVGATVARLGPGFFFFLCSGALKSPDIHKKLGEMINENNAEVAQYVAQIVAQGGFALLVSLATMFAMGLAGSSKKSQ